MSNQLSELIETTRCDFCETVMLTEDSRYALAFHEQRLPNSYKWLIPDVPERTADKVAHLLEQCRQIIKKEVLGLPIGAISQDEEDQWWEVMNRIVMVREYQVFGGNNNE